MRLLLLAFLLALAGCGNLPGQRAAKYDAKFQQFFTEWLQGHGETKIVTDAKGIGLEGNPTRLTASIYGSEAQKGGGYVVETEFKITLPNGAQIVEAGGLLHGQAVHRDSVAGEERATASGIAKIAVSNDAPVKSA